MRYSLFQFNFCVHKEYKGESILIDHYTTMDTYFYLGTIDKVDVVAVMRSVGISPDEKCENACRIST